MELQINALNAQVATTKTKTEHAAITVSESYTIYTTVVLFVYLVIKNAMAAQVTPKTVFNAVAQQLI